MELVELPYLAICAPADVAVPGLAHVDARDLLEPAGRVEARGQLVGERLVVNEPVRMRGANRLFVEMLRVERAAVEARDLGTYQRRAVLEILRTVLGPDGKLSLVARQRSELFPALVARGRLAGRGTRQRGIELVFRYFEQRGRCPQQPLRFRRRIERPRVVPGEEARLQLSDEVPALRKGQYRVAGQMVLEPLLVEIVCVEQPERRRQPAEGVRQPDLRPEDVDDETEPGLLRELETNGGFMLHVHQRIARRQKVRVHVDATVGREREIADPVGRLERATHQVAARLDVFRPRHDDVAEAHVGAGLEAPQSALLNEIVAESTEPESRLVVAEARSGDDAKPDIGEAGSVAV